MIRKILFLILLKMYLMGNMAAASDEDGKAHHVSRMNFAALNVPSLEKKLVEFSPARDKQTVPERVSKDKNQTYIAAQMVERYRKLAREGDAEAQFQLGLLYIDEEVGDDEQGIGMFWVEQAAKQGHHQASVVLDTLEREAASFGC